MDAGQFNAVLLDISDRLSSDNLDRLKFLVGNDVGKQKLEKITTGYKLFAILTERRLLEPNRTEFLSRLLVKIHRPDLSDRLTGSGGPTGPPDDGLDETERAKLNIATEVIAENLGKSWRKLGRKLQVSGVKLDSISQRHSADLEETAVELLKEWRSRRGAEATTEELIGALRDCLFNLTADKVEDKLKAEGYQ